MVYTRSTHGEFVWSFITLHYWGVQLAYTLLLAPLMRESCDGWGVRTLYTKDERNEHIMHNCSISTVRENHMVCTCTVQSSTVL